MKVLETTNRVFHNIIILCLEIETNRSDFHQLYSIGTPTSSEENLSVDDIVVQQEEDTKSTGNVCGVKGKNV